ncbi:hypothetical protein CHS0354_003743 [Potamilus streckersoni]|uniref:Dual specificity protein phosphatase 23 n=1 Tax=Potamilus streckersoni TaxID=2493646 RepID=A0AAE0SNM8_9BIVA|nr:hypothetical protein CHS0354_003743 [Potamilus streckersoni]
MMSKTDTSKQVFPESTPPWNFSWVVDKKLCGMAFPGKHAHINFLLKHNVGCLISLTDDLEPPVKDFPELDYLSVKIEEFCPPTLEQIEKCIAAIEKANQEGKAVGIHCRHGFGRTSTILACYFVKIYQCCAKEAIRRIRSIRPRSIETYEQEGAVKKYEVHLNIGAQPLHDTAQKEEQKTSI